MSWQELKNTYMPGAFMTALGLSACAWMVSTQFGYFYTTPKFLVIVATFLALAIFLSAKDVVISLPASRRIQFTFLAVIVFTLLSAFSTHIGERATGFGLIVLWIGLTFCISVLAAIKKPQDFLRQLIVLQMPFAFFSFVYFFICEVVFKTHLKPFFANPNVASNFISLMLIQIIFFVFITKSKFWKITGILFGILGLVLLVLFQARGAMLGCALGALFCFLHVFDITPEKKTLQKKFVANKKYIYVGLLALAGVIGATQYEKGMKTLRYRYGFWINTVCMIKDYPMGVGPGSFEYIYQGYNGRCVPAPEIGEGINIRNPHNSFIEFFGEIGIGGGIAFLLLLFLVFHELYYFARKKNPFVYTWVVGCSLVLGCVAFFEFPQDTPYTFFYLAVVAGIALSIMKAEKFKFSSRLRSFNLALALIISLIFGVKGYSDHLTVLPGENPEKSLTLACRIDNENWRACTFLGLGYVERGDFEAADRVIAKLSRKFEGHHSLMHLRGMYALKKGEMGEACNQFRQYHALFGFKSSKREFLEKNCPE